MKELVIDRGKWLCKKSHGEARLLNEESGRMCCLGFAGKELGVELSAEMPSGPGWGVPFVNWGLASSFSETAATINDNHKISTEKKEARLKKLFKTVGIKLRFRGKL